MGSRAFPRWRSANVTVSEELKLKERIKEQEEWLEKLKVESEDPSVHMCVNPVFRNNDTDVLFGVYFIGFMSFSSEEKWVSGFLCFALTLEIIHFD